MKRIGSNLTFVVLGFLSFLGVQPSSATTIPRTVAKQIDAVKPTTPLYLQLGIDRINGLSADKDLEKAQYFAHWSHQDHRSHWAHYAHRSHYSHYNGWR